jgi:hypothetical protein
VADGLIGNLYGTGSKCISSTAINQALTFKDLSKTVQSLRVGPKYLTKQEDKRMSFRVGDRVRIRWDADKLGSLDYFKPGQIGIVTDINDDSDYNIEVKADEPLYDEDGDRVVENSEEFRECQLLLLQHNFKGDTKMSDVSSNPLKALTELDLDSDSRLLRELGFENDKGEVTSTGVSEMNRRAWATVRTEVANDLRKAIANEKADKETKAEVKA